MLFSFVIKRSSVMLTSLVSYPLTMIREADFKAAD